MDHTGEAVYFVNDLSPGQKRTPSQPLPTKGEGLDPAALASAISISHFGVALVTWHWTRGARSPSPLWGGVGEGSSCQSHAQTRNRNPSPKHVSCPARPRFAVLRPHRLALVRVCVNSSPERTASHEILSSLGAGRDRRHHGLLSGQGRGRKSRFVARPASGRGSETSYRQLRADLSYGAHDLALGSTGRADERPLKWLFIEAPARCSSGPLDQHRPCGNGACRLLQNCNERGPTGIKQGPNGSDLETISRDVLPDLIAESRHRL